MSYPISFYLASFLLVGLGLEAWWRRQSWFVPALATYFTVLGWYFADLFISEEIYRELPEIILSRSYWQVIAFLVVFRLLVPACTRWQTRSTRGGTTRLVTVNPGILVTGCFVFWLILFIFGCAQVEWDVTASLFPIEGRAATHQMWARSSAGDAGPLGFLISTGGYLYLLVCSFFGVLLVFQKNVLFKSLCIVMMLLTWPFFLLGGTRNSFLAVCMPSIFAYMLLVRHPQWLKAMALVVMFLALDFSFRIVIQYRNVGFEGLLHAGERAEMLEEEKQHIGLNMIQELCFVNIYSYVGELRPTYGQGYLTLLLNFVPRAIWPNKPLFGVEYAKWRGYEGGDSDTGVLASIATGLIGQGVIEFGPLLGPLAPAALMALWCGLLTRWWTQRASLLRLCLFLAGLGTTFNLGRNITPLVLWPVIFGYLIVRLVEALSRTPAANVLPGRLATLNPNTSPAPASHGLTAQAQAKAS